MTGSIGALHSAFVLCWFLTLIAFGFNTVLTPYLVKLFRLCLTTSTFPSFRKYAYVQPVPKKGDRSNPSDCHLIALLSCLSKAFESILNRKIQKPLSTSDLQPDRQYGFRKGRSTGDLLSLLTD